MDAQAGALIALGLVLAAWTAKAQTPPPLANAVGWVLALLGTILLLLASFGWKLTLHD